jgi:hypothetical protein
MRVVYIGMQQTDSQCFDVQIADCFHHSEDLGFRRRCDNHAFCIKALVEFDAVLLRDERARDFEVEIVQLVADLARDGEHVACSFGHDEPRACAFSFDQGVGDERRAVYEFSDGRMPSAICRGHLLEQVSDHRCHRYPRVMRRSERLCNPDAPGGRKHRESVGKGAADVDRDAKAASRDDSRCGKSRGSRGAHSALYLNATLARRMRWHASVRSATEAAIDMRK